MTAALVALTGCREEAPPPESVSDTAERGPLRFVVEVSPKQVLLGDPITVDLRMHTPDDYVVEFPPDDALGGLTIRDVQRPEPRPAAEGGLDWRRTFTAISFTSGPLGIPPMAVRYAKRPAGDGAGAEPQFEHELVTGTLTIEVRGALTSQDAVNRPRDITGTLLPARGITPRDWLLAGIAAAVVAALGLTAYLLLRRRRTSGPPPIAPEIWALRELAALGAQDWIETGRAREYYYSLTHIVRTYIELKFRLAAPEMTTEEFLSTLARNRGALPYDANRLRAFLEACDFVKYAALHPAREDAEQALMTARAFVDATAAAAIRASPPGVSDPEGRAA